jgi:hypothetical protein
MQAMWKHRKALTDSGVSGRFGRVGLPFLTLFGVALPLLAPVIDIMLLYGLVFWELGATMTGWGLMLALQLLTAAVAFRFDHESLRPLWRLPLQQFAYRQLMYLVLIQSAVTALTGGRLRWHKLHRAGLTGARSTTAEAPMIPSTPSVPGQGLAPAVDTWPPVLGQMNEPEHPATGRATARPPVPAQALPPYSDDDLPSAGSPPGGGSGPVFTRGV